MTRLTAVLAAVTIVLLAVAAAGGRLSHSAAGTVSVFSLSQVRLLDGPFKHAQDLDLQYVRGSTPTVCSRRIAPRPG